MKKEDLRAGQVFISESHPKIQYVIVKIYGDSVCMERVTERQQGVSNRHGLGFGWFEHTYTKPLRTMSKKEFNQFKI